MLDLLLEEFWKSNNTHFFKKERKQVHWVHCKGGQHAATVPPITTHTSWRKSFCFYGILLNSLEVKITSKGGGNFRLVREETWFQSSPHTPFWECNRFRKQVQITGRSPNRSRLLKVGLKTINDVNTQLNTGEGKVPTSHGKWMARQLVCLSND